MELKYPQNSLLDPKFKETPGSYQPIDPFHGLQKMSTNFHNCQQQDVYLLTPYVEL